jgi:hypothetical protein
MKTTKSKFMKTKSILQLIVVCFFGLNPAASNAQLSPIPSIPENCKNGIDDDGDGKIDLNDPECFCVTNPSDYSILPNSSFELHNCCPADYSQTECLDVWFRAGVGTTDYLNECGEIIYYGVSPLTAEIFPLLPSLNLLPYPNGDGVVGTVAFNGFNEYLATCLTVPLTAGINYNLKLFLASFESFNSSLISTVPININFYGTNCSNLPFSGIEPDASCVLLGQLTYQPQIGWIEKEINFIPSNNFNAIVFGPEFSLDLYYSEHLQIILYDHLRLTNGNIPKFPILELDGDPCNGEVNINALEHSGLSLSYYENGIFVSEDMDGLISVPVSNPENSIITVKYDEMNTCSIVDLSILSFEDCTDEIEIVFPNVLTTDNNGINDYYIIDIPFGQTVDLTILNRWGNRVYNEEHYSNKWSPTNLSDGVYFYVAKVTNKNGEITQYTGHIQLIGSK